MTTTGTRRDYSKPVFCRMTCGCQVVGVMPEPDDDSIYSIVYCPIHAAAPALLAFVQAFVATMEYHNAEVKLSFQGSALNADLLHALKDARAAIRQAKGKEA